RTAGNAAVKHLDAFAVLVLALFTLDGQDVAMGLDRKIILREAGNRHRNAVSILARALDTVRRISLAAVRLGKRIKHGEEPVETDGRTVQRRKVDVTHGLFSC